MKIIRKLQGLFEYSRLFLKKNEGHLEQTEIFQHEEEPLRSELLSTSQMEHYGKFLATKHILTKKATADKLLPRLAENEIVLRQVFNLLSSVVKSANRITPAAEWLLDNYYLIDEQILTTKNHLPTRYSRELPKLASGPSKDKPRVYDLALEIISHGDGRIDIAKITAFISSYQSATTLTMGELWAIPIMLRLALIENLRRVAVRIAVSRKHHELAEKWVQQFLDTAENNPADLILQVADLARSNPPMVSAFVAEMTRRLQSQKTILTLPLTWISERLSETGMTIEQLIVLETQRQAADQVSISNSIASIRLLDSIDWHQFFESVSPVEQTLKTDPSSIYGQMNFTSRDYYRHVVEKIARHSPFSENEVARKAIELAKNSASREDADLRSSHVGYYLAAEGRSQLEEAAGMRSAIGKTLLKLFSGSRTLVYIGSVTALSILFTAGMLSLLSITTFPMWFRILLGITTLIASSQLAISLINWVAMLVMPSVPLPRMDFSKSIPEGCETLIVVPCMLINKENIDKLCEILEIHYLGNRDEKLRFCLLSDFVDAQTETTENDEELIEHVSRKINELNEQYRVDESSPFWLLHRFRRFNDRENVWMGYERKRGKLEELNAFLRDRSTGFSVKLGDFSYIERIRFVITLDSDTHLFRDTAHQFIATLAHPLNQAVYDEKNQIVTRGYGILQPRVASSLPGSHASIYERLNSGDAGIDPYTRTVSDVYQDLFGEGSFIGKGIYDVDAVSYTLGGRLPQNRILSHDLLEGCYTRSGLLSDVPLYEKYPADYISDVKRRHRWIRGDWQLISWLLPFIPDVLSSAKGKKRFNPLSALSYWKLLDNLRRSLVPPAVVFLFVSAWTVLKPAWAWTLALLAVFFLHPILTFITGVIAKHRNTNIKQHLSACMTATNRHCSNIFLNFMALPHEACYHTDAIARTLWRMLVSRRRMLEWIPSGQIKNDSENYRAYIRMMWFSPLFCFASALAIFIVKPIAIIIAAPFLLLWFFSPLIFWRISQPIRYEETILSFDQTLYLRKLSRKIWAFFDAYVGPEDNWLPPDNVQETPVHSNTGETILPLENTNEETETVIAHRTSPTNIGMALLSYLAACDFAYIPVSQLISRTQNTFNSMLKLDRYCGHFYNWYDTQTLKTIQHPLYVSTVDSGNLAGHLLTMKSGFLEFINQPVISNRLADGLYDTFSLLSENTEKNSYLDLEEIRTELQKLSNTPSLTLHEIYRHLEALTQTITNVTSNTPKNKDTTAGFWGNALLSQCNQMLHEITLLLPWVKLPFWQEQPDRFEKLNRIPILNDLAQYKETVIPEIIVAQNHTPDDPIPIDELIRMITEASAVAGDRIQSLHELASQAIAFTEMDFRFLMNPSSKLLSIGFNVTDRKRDNSYYDLLASEARLSSFVTIAQGQIPQENWFALGRRLTVIGKDAILLSWSGSMFEYLMPQLVMPVYEDTLLDQTHRIAVKKHIEYGAQRRVPWGISESGYYAFDARLNYQYRAFGVPGLGLKRGLGDDLVIAPYASMLALMVDPQAAYQNLIRLEEAGYGGQYGLFEAIDFTPSRLTRGQNHAIVRSFMAHHQGMGFLSLLYFLMDKPMQKRFEAEPSFQATIPLLHERIPKNVPFFELAPSHAMTHLASIPAEMPNRIYNTADTPVPEIQLLSNGHYHVMVTNAGSGYSHWKNLTVSRWYEDATQDNWGTWFYIRDRIIDEYWSTTFQPVRKQHAAYEVIFSEGRAEFRSRENDIETYCEIVVSPEENMEVRRHKITNYSLTERKIEFTCYTEIVIAPKNDDTAHPAFSKLFVQTEIVPKHKAIISTRRPRSSSEKPPYAFHMLVAHDMDQTEVTYETDRMKFIGRGNTAANPAALASYEPLSGSEGSVLDPVAVIRHQFTLPPGESVTIDYVCGIAEDRESCMRMIEKYDDMNPSDRALEMSWSHSQALLHQLNADESDAQLFSRLAGAILYANRSFRAESGILFKNSRGQQELWSYAISGDLPIVLIQIRDQENLDIVRQMLQAHAYWYMKGLKVDMVIWNEDTAGYRQLLQEHIMGMITAIHPANEMNRPGGVFLRQSEQISTEDRILISSVARIIISDTDGPLAIQIKTAERPERRKFIPLSPIRIHTPKTYSHIHTDDLLLYNGTGGFTHDGKEYVINLSKEKQTPAPWVNILANPHFGCVISESGQSYTWHDNAHEFRLTPWNNDPVSDPGGEVFYLRDEETGHYWSPTPLPCPGNGEYKCRHGFGYSVFEHIEDGIHSELWVYVALNANIKYSVLKVRNESGFTRHLSATGYVEWIMGSTREKTHMHIITETNPTTGAIFARNAYNTEFADRIAFFSTTSPNHTITGNRAEFIGRNRTLADPIAMTRAHLSNRIGAGYDPCGAIHVPFTLENGQERQIQFMLGTAGRRSADASQFVQRFSTNNAADAILMQITRHWERVLGAVKVETPDKSLDMLANGWLMYQTIACRLWARSGFYQSGGAFGFRDQLQDAMAVIHTEPQLLRDQILLHSEHQFIEGDVQHWWHPPSGRGVRTHCSDDYLWLPLAVCRYIKSTGDAGILDEITPFLEGPPVPADQDSYYDMPFRSAQTDTIYQHCIRAINYGLRFGVHGLPLIGSCDWNDGMDKVGEHGKGESVWLGFFLYSILLEFAELARNHDDASFAEKCLQEADGLRKRIHDNAWDGAWYRRAYFDDGTPLGSAQNEECRIDSISQSWSILSGAGDEKRARQAMDSLNQFLVRRDQKLIQLLDPPFDKSSLNPGYIKGYVPGVRENGGQYTHAAIWAVMAFAKLHDTHLAWELFNLINPLNHSTNQEEAHLYKVEPYVVAADVYAVPPHTGRGGWTWYTGSSGWMYRLILESLIGITLDHGRLRFDPCLPPEWPSVSITYRHMENTYHIIIEQSDELSGTEVYLDKVKQEDPSILLVNDQKEHQVRVRTGKHRNTPPSGT